MGRPGFAPQVGKILWRRAWQHAPAVVFLPGGSPWTQEPGKFQSTGWQLTDMTTDGHDRLTKQSIALLGVFCLFVMSISKRIKLKFGLYQMFLFLLLNLSFLKIILKNNRSDTIIHKYKTNNYKSQEALEQHFLRKSY